MHTDPGDQSEVRLRDQNIERDLTLPHSIFSLDSYRLRLTKKVFLSCLVLYDINPIE